MRLSGCGALLLISARTFAASPGPLRPLVNLVSKEVDAERGMETMRHVYSTDRWFTFPKFEETARYLKQRLEESGVEQVDIGGAVADGRTQAGFWTMPLAWDVKEARLEMIAPERAVLCDYRQAPSSLGMWSGATPPEGVTAELVDVASNTWANVKGKLVLTDKNSAGYKHDLVKHGALGAVNGFSENPALKDGRQWVNAWGDNGWGFTKASTPLLSFSITPRQAEHVRQLMKAGKKVMVQAFVRARYYEGRYPWVTGVLRGTNPEEEVLVLGHTSEQGAQDNATGVAAMMEALHTLARLVDSARLPRPKRSIRILLMPELYGSLSYISAHTERMQHTVAAMTVDTPAASYDLAGTEYTFYMNPHAAMSYTDALIPRIAEAYFSSARPWHWKETEPGTDSYLGDPTAGVPDPWVYSGTGVVTHHNSEDTPAKVDARSLRDLIALISTYLYFNASAGAEQMSWLADITFSRSCEMMASAASMGIDGVYSGHKEAGGYGLARVSYLADRAREAVLSVLRLAPGDHARESLAPVLERVRAFRDLESSRLRAAGARPRAEKAVSEPEKIVVRRKRPGTIPLDDLPREKWEGYPSGAWDKLVTTALYWCDGKRNLAEVMHLTEMEMGPSNFDFAGYFRFLEKHGYVEFAK